MFSHSLNITKHLKERKHSKHWGRLSRLDFHQLLHMKLCWHRNSDCNVFPHPLENPDISKHVVWQAGSINLRSHWDSSPFWHGSAVVSRAILFYHFYHSETLAGASTSNRCKWHLPMATALSVLISLIWQFPVRKMIFFYMSEGQCWDVKHTSRSAYSLEKITLCFSEMN